MRDSSPGFIRQTSSGAFTIDWRRIAPESYLATDRLLREIVKRRELAFGNMLDIGCGTKPYEAVFAPYVRRHVGIDMPFSPHEQTRIDIYGSATQLPFSDASFDFVLCTEVLEHLPEPQQCLTEIGRVLRPGGIALVTSPFMYRIHEAPYDFFRYTPFSYKYMAEKAGLHVEDIAGRGGLLTVCYDMLFKVQAAIFGALNQLIRRFVRTRKHLLQTSPVRAMFALPQFVLARLLRYESIKSDVYTLGYVVTLRKASI
ncbi:MAG: class I SAM-dependent methyltransferase [Candidatus Sumerlaeaceae bacterium]